MMRFAAPVILRPSPRRTGPRRRASGASRARMPSPALGPRVAVLAPTSLAIGSRRKVAGQRPNVPGMYLCLHMTGRRAHWPFPAGSLKSQPPRSNYRDPPKMSVQARVLVGRTADFPSMTTTLVVGFSSRAAAPGKGRVAADIGPPTIDSRARSLQAATLLTRRKC
jgi:hypothetical protein